jgi:predicted O-linked N-acetylglucosamine transferase (SPINDLY family)
LISDDATILPSEERFISEKVIRLPWSRFCFTPFAYLPDVVPPPSIANGFITLGSFNNLTKINPMVISLWSRALRELPGSRLIFKRGGLGDSRIRQRFSDLFAENGVNLDRIDFRDNSSYGKMLSEYGEVDIALDPFPFSGGATTLDALLMGAPVVTLSGKLPISRQTRSFYRVLNLLELVARNEDRYCAIIADLARDPIRLRDLRYGLRKRVMNSYLCNGIEFTRNLEKAYRTMWLDWCSTRANAGTHAGCMAGE